MPGDVLGLRTLNRALLARQLLLDRVAMPVPEAIEHLIALQAQSPNDPYFGLWSRLQGFDAAELSSLLETRAAVRIALLRATVHLVTARDCLSLRAILQPVLQRLLYSGSPFGRNLKDIDVAELLAVGRELLEAQPRTNAQLASALRERWPDHDANSLSMAVHYLLPLVQIPPRGLWGASGQAVHTTAEAWLSAPLEVDTSPDVLVPRYLAAFGPAGASDFRAWSGLTAAQSIFERLRPQLRTYRDERGRELFDLPGATLPDSDSPSSPRFLPVYDNVELAHSDRARIVSEEHRKRGIANISRPTVRSSQGSPVSKGSFLLDGFGAGTWTLLPSSSQASLTLEPFEKLSAADAHALQEEGARLLAFAAPGLEHDDITIVPPD